MWYGTIRNVWYGMGMVWYDGIVRYGLVWYGTVSYRIVSYRRYWTILADFGLSSQYLLPIDHAFIIQSSFKVNFSKPHFKFKFVIDKTPCKFG